MEILKQLRKQNKKSQQDVADFLGVNRGTYANYELGKREPDFDTLRRIAEYFNVSIDYLLGHDVSTASNPEKKERDDAALEKMFEDDKDTLRFIKDNQISFDGEIYDLSDEGFLMLKNAILLAIREVKNAE